MVYDIVMLKANVQVEMIMEATERHGNGNTVHRISLIYIIPFNFINSEWHENHRFPAKDKLESNKCKARKLLRAAFSARISSRIEEHPPARYGDVSHLSFTPSGTMRKVEIAGALHGDTGGFCTKSLENSSPLGLCSPLLRTSGLINKIWA
ncbi:uncharacterized protein BDR25DRAFT_348016 [Lindgomyces ingoldianus]|uniref:Uncharacterized protein n=1 Tax=Lindgomyces ingoldianus TaxID=673940 RepID=A0ACB6REB6_9PLEO|nr:uncharacterized protein BDR25DRAFT_348016 [Lindgomyces ingoldianus]KAF2477694.1 hypothetical protein BDR25DRAFT_348016 [Lindgomyces ingoldianus]